MAVWRPFDIAAENKPVDARKSLRPVKTCRVGERSSHTAETHGLDDARPEHDAERALDAMTAGGMSTRPLDVAYAVISTTPQAIRKIFSDKGRSYEKPSGMFAIWEMSRDIHFMPAEHRVTARIIVEE